MCPHKALTLGWLQTEMNIYICFDLCTGGELFTRICNKGCYPEMFVLALLSSSWALTISLDKRSRLSTPSWKASSISTTLEWSTEARPLLSAGSVDRH